MSTTPKKIFQLVNVENQLPLDIGFGNSDPTTNDWRFCDFDLDGAGNIKLIQQQEATVQTILKCVFTEKQNSGYGTSIMTLIGEKDLIVRRTLSLMDLSMSIIALKSFNDAQAVTQNLSPDDLISSISKFVVMEDPNNVSKSIIKLTILTNSNASITVGVL